MLTLYEEREPVDLVTLTEKLKTMKALTQVGGRAYLSKLATEVPTSAHADEYGRIIKDHYVRRELIRAAALLTEEEVTLENISDLLDTEVLLQILKKLGVTVKKEQSVVKIKASQIRHSGLPEDLMVKLRGSIVLVGAILGRLGKVNFYHPGGDIIGRRSIETHIEGFKALGVSLQKSDVKYSLLFDQNSGNKIYNIFLQEASVTATENLVLVSVLGDRSVILRNFSQPMQYQPS